MGQIDGDIHPGGPGGQLQESLWLPDASFRAYGLSLPPCAVESLPSPAGEETPPGPATQEEMLGLPLKMETVG